MNIAGINEWIPSLLSKTSLQDCSVDELSELTNSYPYFNAAQLLLALKLKEENNSTAGAQLQKLSLFLYDHLAAQPFFAEKKIEVSKKAEKTEPVLPPAETVQQPEVIRKPEPAVQTIFSDPAASIVETSPGKENETMAKDELVFEPFHTVDYFASQGIRFKADEKPVDKFGQQLKSFTEWLKTLKKISDAVPAAIESVNPDLKVEQLAEHSIADREVVTEAMAEVWLKQGNTEQAAAVYRKLSLLNPSKSSYFAGLIEKLKTT